MADPAKILYVEDDPGLARLVQRRLVRAGYEVVLAADGEDGIARLGEPFDVAITDYRMPGRNGLDVITAAKQKVPDLPVVMVSGMGDLEVAVQAMKLGALEYVIKDVEGSYLDLLPAVIERLLENRRVLEAKRAAEQALAAERALSRLAVDCLAQGLAVFDADLRLRLCNSRFLSLSSYPEELGRVGTPLADMLRFNARRGDYGDEPEDEAVERRLGRAGRSHSFQYERETAAGLVVEVVARPMPEGGFVATYTDITERKRAEQEIWRRAHYDGLTGVANRALFHELLKRQLARSERDGQRFGLLFIDLDGFKAVNDTMGHDAGDLLLKKVAERLGAAVRESDVVARLGGDEFTVLLLSLRSLEDAGAVAGSIITRLSEPYDLTGREARISASIGVACYPDTAQGHDELVRKADDAMYVAKAAGKGRWQLGG